MRIHAPGPCSQFKCSMSKSCIEMSCDLCYIQVTCLYKEAAYKDSVLAFPGLTITATSSVSVLTMSALLQNLNLHVDDLTILLLLIAATLFLLTNLYRPQALVHPIVLGRQSDVGRARDAKESAVYRNYGTGLVGRVSLCVCCMENAFGS